MFCYRQYISIDQKKFGTPILTPLNRTQTSKNRLWAFDRVPCPLLRL